MIDRGNTRIVVLIDADDCLIALDSGSGVLVAAFTFCLCSALVVQFRGAKLVFTLLFSGVSCSC